MCISTLFFMGGCATASAYYEKYVNWFRRDIMLVDFNLVAVRKVDSVDFSDNKDTSNSITSDSDKDGEDSTGDLEDTETEGDVSNESETPDTETETNQEDIESEEVEVEEEVQSPSE